MFDESFYAKKYNETFESVYRMLEWNKENLDSYGIGDLEKFRDSQYDYDSVNMLGRSELKDRMIQATIAASEALLERWKEELAGEVDLMTK